MKYIWVLIILVAVVITGCSSLGGTFLIEKDNKIYIGIRRDVCYINNWEEYGSVAVPISAIDLPFSLIMDTILLPYTIPKTLLTEKSEKTDEKTCP